MKHSNATMLRFYQHLGRVFHLVVAADKTVRPEETSKLKEIIKAEWLPVDDTIDEFGEDSAYQIEMVFDWLIENEWDIEQVLPAFKEFKEGNPSIFTEDIKRLIIKTANAIANAYNGKNKVELGVIAQIYLILTKKNK